MSASQFDLQAKELKSVVVPYSAVTPSVPVADGGKVVKVPADQVVTIRRVHGVASIAGQNVPTTFNGTTVDFRIRPGDVGLIKDLALQVKLTETGGSASVTPVNSFYWTTQIEIWGNGGDLKLQTLYPEMQEFLLGAFFTTEQQNRLAALGNYTTSAYAGETAISASGSATYFIPLLGSLFSVADIYGPALQGDLIVRVFLRNGIVKSGTGVIGLTSMNLLIEHEILPEEDKMELLREYKENIQERNYLETLHYVTSQIFTASTSTSLEMSPFLGLCPYLIYMFRSSTAVAAGAIYNFASQGTANTGAAVEIDSSTGTNLLQSTSLAPDYILNFDSVQHFQGPITNVLNLYPIVFGNPVSAEQDCVRDGGLYFSGKELIKWTFGSGFSTGTFQLDVFARVFRHLHIENGRFKSYIK